MSVLRFERTEVEVSVASPALADAIAHAIQSTFDAFPAPPAYPVVRLRTFRRLATVDLTGHIVIVRVTHVRRLPALVEAIRAKGALGVQLVWDGVTPPRALAERAIFEILETARATKHLPPVVLAAERTPTLALRALVAARSPS